MLTGPTLAQAVATGMGFASVSSIMLAWGDSVADEINNNAVSPFPLSGPITGLSGSRIATAFGAETGLTPTSEVIAFSTEIANHIMLLGVETGGLISGLNGTVLATAIHGSAGYPGSPSSQLINFCTALVTNIMTDTMLTH